MLELEQNIKMDKVNSSNIDEIGYVAKLRIKFRDGSIYDYYDVPREKYDQLMITNSKGSFFHREIKSKYTCINLIKKDGNKK